MSMTDKQFDKFLDTCYENLVRKQERLFQQYGIGTFEEYWYDQDSSVLQFKTGERVELECHVVFIGSWSKASSTWMWSWANESMTDHVRASSLTIQELQQVTGFDIFTNPSFDCDEGMAHELTALAVEHLQAEGMYISPNGQAELFMALMSPTKR